MLHLFYRLIVQPNTSRSQTFAEAFISCGGIETLLVLLQREAKAGDHIVPEFVTKNDENVTVQGSELDSGSGVSELSQGQGEAESEEERELISPEKDCEPGAFTSSGNSVAVSTRINIERMTSASENFFIKDLGGISSSISADNARNNVYNVDKSDGIVVGIIGLLGALVTSGHLQFGPNGQSDMTRSLLGSGMHDGNGTMFDDKVSLLLFALQKAFQAAPNRLMTSTVYTSLLGASV